MARGKNKWNLARVTKIVFPWRLLRRIMAVYGGRQFLVCLQKPSELRTPKVSYPQYHSDCYYYWIYFLINFCVIFIYNRNLYTIIYNFTIHGGLLYLYILLFYFLCCPSFIILGHIMKIKRKLLSTCYSVVWKLDMYEPHTVCQLIECRV